MKRGVLWVVGGGFVLFLLAGCGGSTTPDTEGQTLSQAFQTLREAGVPEGNVSVTGDTGDTDDLTVCGQEPDGADPAQPVTLEVATNCPDEDDDRDKKRKKRSSGGNRR